MASRNGRRGRQGISELDEWGYVFVPTCALRCDFVVSIGGTKGREGRKGCGGGKIEDETELGRFAFFGSPALAQRNRMGMQKQTPVLSSRQFNVI
jgi:hypothetical protein